MAKWNVRITYNGSVVLLAIASTTIAYENVARLAEAYAPADANGLPVMVPDMLGRMVEAEVGSEFSDAWVAVGGAMVDYEVVRLEA